MKSILDEFAEQKKAGNNTRKVLQFSDDANSVASNWLIELNN